jgi:hypothetical protein
MDGVEGVSGTGRVESVSGTGEEGAADIEFHPQDPPTEKLQQTQAKVDEVYGIMHGNVQKILERDEKLSELDRRADLLEQGASQFTQTTAKIKRKCWWKNLKVIMFFKALVLLLVVILIIWGITSAFSN